MELRLSEEKAGDFEFGKFLRCTRKMDFSPSFTAMLLSQSQHKLASQQLEKTHPRSPVEDVLCPVAANVYKLAASLPPQLSFLKGCYTGL